MVNSGSRPDRTGAVLNIAAWLRDLGLERYAEAFEANDIDTAVLHSLNADDLKELGVTSLGHRKRLLEAIAALIPQTSTYPDRRRTGSCIGVADRTTARPSGGS